jgi:hypothetical protein
MFGATVFTEADLDKAVERHPDETRERCLREGGVLDSTVVLALGAVEQSQEEAYVYAEQLCDASTLSSFRGDLPRLREADVAVFRESLVRL